MHIICTSLQTDNYASTSSVYAQPTVSKHWRLLITAVIAICLSLICVVIDIPPVAHTYAPERLCTSDFWIGGCNWFESSTHIHDRFMAIFQRHGSLLTFWRFTNRIIIIIIIILGLPRWASARRNLLLDFIVQGEISEADTHRQSG